MKSYAVIGLGQFGSQVAISLTQKGFHVIGLDSSEEVVNDFKDLISRTVILDTTDESAMRAVNVDTVDMALVAIGSNVQDSLLTVALLQKLGIENDDIYVRAIDPLQEGILKSMGITNIVNIESEMGKQMSVALSSGKIGRYINISEHHSLTEVNIPKPLIGHNLKDLNVRVKYKVNIVGIKQLLPTVKDDGDISYKMSMTDVPNPEYPLQETDVLVLVGTDEHIDAFIRLGGEDE